MRQDSIQYAQAARAPSKRPRYIVKIEFPTGSKYCTSHDDITGVPGVVLNAVLQEPSALSQRLIPDEGRSEIGAFTFSLIDKDSQFTDEIRAKLLTDFEGIRGRRVIFYDGYEGFDFTDFQVFQTQTLQYTSYHDGAYTVRCADITREQRQNICEPKFTTLRDSVNASVDTIPVYVTADFDTVAHGTSWSDAPSSSVGYIKIEDEIVRYTGKTADSFTGCARGALNTKAVEHQVDAGTAAERRTKVEEYIYLELPCVKLAWAILTGQIYGTANTLPDHWHLGIDPALIRESDFTGIGLDLWDPSDDSASLPLRFEGLKKTDGKRFLEKEIYLVIGCYSPVYSDGALGLRRLPALISDSAPVATLTEREVTSMGELTHDEQGMHNVFRVNWNWDPAKEEFTRITYFTDADSVSIHGSAPLMEYSFKGMHGSRHTDAVVAGQLHALRDAYAHPPERISVTVHGSLSYIEIGDVVRLKVTNLRDYAGTLSSIDRAFAVLQKTHRSVRNEVTFDLFGSTARPLVTPPGSGVTAPLPDAFYTSAGTVLSTIATITGNVMATGSFTITGNANLTNSGAIFYWDNDLTIPSGCNLTIAANVQLRIKGFLTLNGTINGVGGGHAGVSDPGTGSWDTTFSGNPGYVGHSRGWDGLKITRQFRTGMAVDTVPALFTRGANDAFPLLSLAIVGGTLTGLPDDLRGTGGAPGGRLLESFGSGAPTIDAAGGAGANGGAGLAIICRGMSTGAATSINLSGADPATPSLSAVLSGDAHVYPGSGGAGGPGAMLILLDGNSISVPDITGKFIAATGTITQPGTAMTSRTGMVFHPHDGGGAVAYPYTDSGYQDESVISSLDFSNAAHRIQYLIGEETPNGDTETTPPAPSALTASRTTGGNLLTWTNPDLDSFDVIEVYASIDNDRTNAVNVGETRGTSFTHSLPLGGLRYYWIRAKRNPIGGRIAVFSDFYPSSSTAGVSSNADTPGEIPEAPADFSAVGKTNGIQFTWSLPWAKLLGLIELWEYTASSPFSSATKIWEGYAVGVFIAKSDTTTRYYWLTLNRSGERSLPEPIGAGLPAAAASFVSTLYVTTLPVSLFKSAGVPPPNPKSITTASTTATASGGTGPYTYAWDWANGGTGITIDSPTSATTTFTASHIFDGTTLSGTARITVTDSTSATATYVVVVTMNWPSSA